MSRGREWADATARDTFVRGRQLVNICRGALLLDQGIDSLDRTAAPVARAELLRYDDGLWLAVLGLLRLPCCLGFLLLLARNERAKELSDRLGQRRTRCLARVRAGLFSGSRRSSGRNNSGAARCRTHEFVTQVSVAQAA